MILENLTHIAAYKIALKAYGTIKNGKKLKKKKDTNKVTTQPTGINSIETMENT